MNLLFHNQRLSDHPINPLNVVRKLFKTITQKKVVGHLNRNNLLNDKQYIFRSSSPTADVLTVITHRIIEALVNKFITRAIMLVITKPLTRSGMGGSYTNSPVMTSLERVFSIIMSFLPGRFMMFIFFNGHSSEAHKINVGFPYGSHLSLTMFMLYTICVGIFLDY